MRRVKRFRPFEHLDPKTKFENFRCLLFRNRQNFFFSGSSRLEGVGGGVRVWVRRSGRVRGWVPGPGWAGCSIWNLFFQHFCSGLTFLSPDDSSSSVSVSASVTMTVTTNWSDKRGADSFPSRRERADNRCVWESVREREWDWESVCEKEIECELESV